MSAAVNEYDFMLTRAQRMLSLLAEWLGPILLLCFLSIGTIQEVIHYPVTSGIVALLLLFFLRGLVFGLIDLFRDGKRHVEIQDGGIGFGRNAADWWISTDGIRQIRRNRWGTTSIRHHNGVYVDIPTRLISQEDFQRLEIGLKKYRDFQAYPKKSEAAQRSSDPDT